MQIFMSKNRVETKKIKPFTNFYDEIYVSIDEENFSETNNFELSETNMNKLLDVLNYSWDGEIYWFSKEYKDDVLKCLNNWFKNEENHIDFDDNAISNCFLIKYTPNGICLIDTQLDMTSNITEFFQELNKVNPNITYEYYSDCHLIDNFYLGRESMNNEFETLYLLYKENVINSSFFLNGISSFTIDDEDNEYNNLLPSDKKIVITGKLDCEREYVLGNLKEVGYETVTTVSKNSWLWYSSDADSKKIQTAKNKKVKCNSIDEVIEIAYQKYLENKKNSE